MKKPITAVGDRVEMLCSVCDIEQQQIVRTVTKLGTITKVTCEKCETDVTFSRGVKTSIRVGKGKNASPYDRTRTYRKGQSMMHDTFGQGEVTAIIDSHKIDVLFGETTRRMLHAS